MAAGRRIGCLGLLVTVLMGGAVGCDVEGQGDQSSESGRFSSAPRATREPHQAEHRPDSDRRSKPAGRPGRRPAGNGPAEKRDRAKPTHEPQTASRRKLHPVIGVVDGDTVEVRYRGSTESVRLIGIDTPETVHPSEPVECWGPHASAAARRWLDGRQVRLRFDRTQGRWDSYDRLLAYVLTPGYGDFGLRMIRAGHAAEYTYDGAYAHRPAYLAAERKARRADRGLWRRCGGVDVPLKAPTGRAPSAQPLAGQRCGDGYSPCVPPYPPDVDCSDVDGPIDVRGKDPHALDADGDGRACEA